MAAHGFSAPSGGASLYAGLLSVQPGSAAPASSTSDASSGPVSTAAEFQRTEPAAEKSKSNWSAALGFQPVRRKAAAPKTAPAALSTSYNVATIVSAPKLTVPPPVDDLDGAAVPVEGGSRPNPPLSLPETAAGEDVNGFRQTTAGKRASQADKKKRKKKRKNEEDATTDFSADYDPARPNDYAEWKSFCKWRKAEEREARRREQEAEEDDDDSSASDADERDRTRGKFFAPPTAFYAASASAEPAEPAPTDSPPYQTAASSPPYQPTTPPPAVPMPPRSPPPQTGEDAYARRMAMSSVQSGDDAYARRAAMSMAMPQTGDAAYANRAAMSDPPPLPPAPSGKVEDAQARARAIAERLSKMGADGPPTIAEPPSRSTNADQEEMNRPNPQAFAAKLMAKYGWKKGQGLGASESGMVNPLTVSQAGGKEMKDPAGTKAPVGFSSNNRGTIISDQKAAREQTEKERFGEPSRIVLLRNVVGRNDVDDDLAGEIGEEAAKHGYVERCKIHIMPFNTPDDQAVRIFVLFSGLVGAWKAVRELDGRHFGGRAVRATFFDEQFFERGAYGIGD